MPETAREAWVAMQKKTFTRWANQYIAKRGLSIDDLTEDLKDGIKLANLLEVISEESVGRITKNPKFELQMYENLNLCIKFLKAHDIPLVNIGSQDIYKSNEKLILGLLWTIILRFEVADAEGKQGLLLWIQRSLKDYPFKVENFTTSWTSGLPFCALIHRFRPDLLDYDTLNHENALESCEIAFSVAESQLGIARLLDPEDVANVEMPDEKSNVAYLSQFFKLFAGAAKNDALIRAIHNAVEVSRRHDAWANHYESQAVQVADFCESKTAELTTVDDSDSTEQVRKKLDEFARYLKETKAEQQAARDDVSSVYTTLRASKRNNQRPDFEVEITPSTISKAWDELEAAEQQYERDLLEKYSRYQRVDHEVSKFSNKAAVLEAGLQEKMSVFAEGVHGSSVPELESQLEVHEAYESRLKQYKQMLEDLSTIAEGVSENGQGHRALDTMADELQRLSTNLAEVEEKGQEHQENLKRALEEEKELLQVYRKYMQGVDNLDFKLDQLEELVQDLNFAVTAEEIEQKIESTEGLMEQANEVLEEANSFVPIAAQIECKLADAPSHVAIQVKRAEDAVEGIQVQEEQLQEKLAREQFMDELKHKFAEAANGFDEFCEARTIDLASVSGSLEEQQQGIAQVKEDASGGESMLEELGKIADECDEAEIIGNPYTSHTLNSLTAKYVQLGKSIQLADDSISDQIISKKAFEVSPEVLREIKQVYEYFDTSGHNSLTLQQLKEACKGIGLDLDDREIEKRMKVKRPDMEFSLDDFIALNVEELQTGDSKDDVVDAFKTLAGGQDSISPEQIANVFQSSPGVIEYLQEHLVDGDFKQFTDELFSR